MAGDDKSERGNEKQLPRPSPRKRKRNDGRHDLPESQSYDFPSPSFSSTLINGKSTFSDLASGPHLTVEIEKSDRKRWKKATMLLYLCSLGLLSFFASLSFKSRHSSLALNAFFLSICIQRISPDKIR
ncbi:hypothetical protein MRB53_000526 [Persea americana]|uniref:Uncharacterized protein n=1 Tax=Persea americana TaxID=3435 RepID=A0ACC2MQ22_PERAE|nr:hypothetical protein MRB53_000526 [Persea americana]